MIFTISMLMVAGSLSAQLNKNKYPQTKVYRGDSVVILSIDQSNYINKTFKEQREALDSFKVVTDTLVRYRDSVTVKYVTADSILTVTDSLRKELLSYKKKVEEAAKLGLYVTYDSIREQAKFLPFDKDFKVQMKETDNGVKIFATNFDQFTKTRIMVGSGLALISGLSYGINSEVVNDPWDFSRRFPNLPTTFWDHYGKTGPSSWERETRIGNLVFKSDLWHLSKGVGVTTFALSFPISLYETTKWKQVIARSLINSVSYTIGYNISTKIIIK